MKSTVRSSARFYISTAKGDNGENENARVKCVALVMIKSAYDIIIILCGSVP